MVGCKSCIPENQHSPRKVSPSPFGCEGEGQVQTVSVPSEPFTLETSSSVKKRAPTRPSTLLLLSDMFLLLSVLLAFDIAFSFQHFRSVAGPGCAYPP